MPRAGIEIIEARRFSRHPPKQDSTHLPGLPFGRKFLSEGFNANTQLL
jgi:hypothetical protein